jgi:hypothetical protein
MSASLAATGVLVVRDPRVSSADNDKFLRMMQRYYAQPVEVRHCLGSSQAAAAAAVTAALPSACSDLPARLPSLLTGGPVTLTPAYANTPTGTAR